jgi:hypothetical protein
LDKRSNCCRIKKVKKRELETTAVSYVFHYISPMPPMPPGGIPPPGGPPADLPDAITSSILRIIDATSVADLIICSFTDSGSTISSFDISVILEFLASTPIHFEPLLCFARSSVIVSIGSMPAFSANVSGTTSNASENFCAASCSRPESVLAHSANLPATCASGAPPPATMAGFSITSFVTILR